MANNSNYGPTGKNSVTGYRLSPAEHQLRLAFALGGLDTGMQDAEDVLVDSGRTDLLSGTRKSYQKARDMLGGIEWNVYTLVENDAQASIARDGPYPPLDTSELSSVAQLSQFDISLPAPIVVASSTSGSNYAWAPTDESVSICLCPAKLWQQDKSLLCKHEIAALLAMHDGHFDIDTTNLPAERSTLVSKAAYRNYGP